MLISYIFICGCCCCFFSYICRSLRACVTYFFIFVSNFLFAVSGKSDVDDDENGCCSCCCSNAAKSFQLSKCCAILMGAPFTIECCLMFFFFSSLFDSNWMIQRARALDWLLLCTASVRECQESERVRVSVVNELERSTLRNRELASISWNKQK